MEQNLVSQPENDVRSDRTLVPLQSPLPIRQHRRAARLGRHPHRPAPLPGHHRGCV